MTSAATSTSIFPALNILLYSPYIPDHFGGGERYLLSVAQFLSRSHQVSVAIPESKHLTSSQLAEIKHQYEAFFRFDLRKVNFISAPMGPKANSLKRLWWTKQYDLIYYLTDGSLFFSLARRNILHIQFPFPNAPNSRLFRFKLKNWQVINTNSEFTQHVIERTWRAKVEVVHSPYVDTVEFKPASKKANIILHVGRFFSHLHTKRQDVLVASFKDLYDKHQSEMKGWQLVLIGGVEDEVYADKVTKMAAGYPIKIIHNANYETLKSYYAMAKIYWHATGYEIDEFINPLAVEHFGISTLEAMASGAVPVVINKGGQKEIVTHGVNGFLWNDLPGLAEKTLSLINGEVEIDLMAERARERAKEFTPEKFYQLLGEMIDLKQPIYRLITSRVSAVVPTYNGRQLLEHNLPAIFACLRAGDELVLVDDASQDNTVDWLVEKFHLQQVADRAEFDDMLYRGVAKFKSKEINISLLQQKQNLRFAAAANSGVNLAEHDLILLLNSDVQPRPDILDHLVPYFLSPHHHDTGIFAVGCLEREQLSDKKMILSGKNRLWFSHGLFHHRRAENMFPGETAWVSGGSGLFDRQKWLELGGFRADFYPAYWEDIDLSWRAKNRGWQVLFDDQAEVNHHHESTNESTFGQDTITTMSYRNALIFSYLNARGWQRLSFWFWMPYHLLVTNRKSHGVFMTGWLGFINYLFSL